MLWRSKEYRTNYPYMFVQCCFAWAEGFCVGATLVAALVFAVLVLKGI